MKDRVFVDTNVFVYSYFKEKDDTLKHEQARHLLLSFNERDVFISTQVLNEFYNASLKYKVSDETIQIKIKQIVKDAVLSVIKFRTIEDCWRLKSKYQYSYYDSLIISSALENKCSILYSEDMQDGQIIEEKLKIINPFKTV